MPHYRVPEVTGLPSGNDPKACRRRVVVITNGCTNSLEYFGPVQVFLEANFFLDRVGRSDIGYDVEVAAIEPGPVFQMAGLRMEVERPYHALSGVIDTLFFQALDEEEVAFNNKDFVRWVSDMSKKVRRISSVCVGTFLLAEAGVLDGRRATSHWIVCDELQRRYPKVTVDPDPIYVKDGNVYTSAGSTAGIDLAVAMVEEDYGTGLALRVAQGLVMYMKRPGNQAQFSAQLSSGFSESTAIEKVRMHIADNLDGDLSVEALADRAGMSPRNFARVFVSEVGVPPGRYVEESRLERARNILEQTDTPIAQVARRCGYRSPDGLRTAFDRHLSVSPREYRRRFATAVTR